MKTLKERADLFTTRMNSALYGLYTMTGIGFLSWIIMLVAGMVFGPDYDKVGKDGGPTTNFEAIWENFSGYPWKSMVIFSIIFFVVPALFCFGCYIYYLVRYNSVESAEIEEIVNA